MKIQTLLFLCFVGIMSFVACSDEEEPTTNSIVDVVLADQQFSILASALERTNLTATLQSAGPFTVFAPTNDAFARLGVDLNSLSDSELSNILLYHVLGARVASTDLAEGQTYASTASASGPDQSALSILVEKNGASVKLNGSVNVSSADISAENGVIHVVDQVILPLDVVGHAAANANFSTLVSVLSNAPGDLVNVLSSQGPFTVFAPVNGAFASITDVVATLTPDQIASVLTYHVVGGANVRSTQLSNNMNVSTVNGQSFMVNLTDGVKLVDAGGNSVNVVLTDVQATNGVIHVLDQVIIPNL